MQIDDLPAVMAIEQQVYPHPWTQGHFTDALRAGYLGFCLVERFVSSHSPSDEATNDERLLGYGVLMPALDECHLLNLSIHAAWQGKGLGRFLLDWCEMQVSKHRCQSMLLEVRASNTAARRLYERQGYLCIGVRKGYYPASSGREDAIVMRKAVAGTGKQHYSTP